ncbi:hypothetical protein [Streptomyces sp. NPDC002855]|uniref:hypothetical protein n=1 Tax=Streptomyces sp. NPDC002855 TaxID=3154437 RepID=UPI0033186118
MDVGVPWRDIIKTIEAGRFLLCQGRPALDGEWAVVKTGALTRGEFLGCEHKAVRAEVRVEERHEIRAGGVVWCRANSPARRCGCPSVRLSAQRHAARGCC